MFSWLTNRRREKLIQAPFLPDWECIIQRNVAYFSMLDDAERIHLRELIQVFVAEKDWEGCGGLELTDEIRVTISAQACLLLLGLTHNYYRNVETILVYPSAVVPPQRHPGFFETAVAPVEDSHPIIGQAFLQGPVIIIWDSALHGGRHPELGHNVVYHEFAHKLDMLDGAADGTPPLRNRAEYHDWVEICTREYLRLKHDAEHGKKSFLNAYGATNEAEFFAVATEQFFDQPSLMIKHTPDLYRVLKEYYRQDPALRVVKNLQLSVAPHLRSLSPLAGYIYVALLDSYGSGHLLVLWLKRDSYSTGSDFSNTLSAGRQQRTKRNSKHQRRPTMLKPRHSRITN